MTKLKHANGNHPLTEQEKENMIQEAAKHYGNYIGKKILILQIHQ